MEVNMNSNSIKLLAASTLAVAGLLGIVPQAQASPLVQEKVVFACEVQNNQYVTVQKYIRQTTDLSNYPVYQEEVLSQTDPLITWTATLGSDHPDGAYIPESRCQAVSARLTNLASALGINTPDKIAILGDMSDNGVVNHEKVIFLSLDPDYASEENVIFTLKPANRDDSATILTQFQVGVAGAIGGAELSAEELPPIVE
jgi:hypothetical protein